MGVVNTTVEEKGKEPVNPLNDTGMEEFIDFCGKNHVNVGTYKDKPNEGDSLGSLVLDSLNSILQASMYSGDVARESSLLTCAARGPGVQTPPSG